MAIRNLCPELTSPAGFFSGLARVSMQDNRSKHSWRATRGQTRASIAPRRNILSGAFVHPTDFASVVLLRALDDLDADDP
jgi:hypothetical protein